MVILSCQYKRIDHRKDLCMKKKKFTTLIVTCILVATLFAGCGQEDMNSLDRVLESGKFTVVGSGGYPPFNYMEDGEVVGFDVEVGEEIARRLGVELNYATSDWDGLIEGLRSKRYDAILGSMAITNERLEVVNFSVPYYFSGAQLFTRLDAGVASASEMSGKKIAVATGTNFVGDAEGLGAEAVYYQDDNATMMELISKRVDGVITDRLVGLQAMKEMASGEDIVMVDTLLRLENMGIAFNKDDIELLDEVNKILQDMHADGTLKKISEKWMDGVDITIQ